ncbi:splicing factor 3b [Capsaspora owczarzaki ATCC 30864]|uniref:Splicing factor 3b n=1 Tax=Capsaspora owczarzaki (strain ATCC 30864) TaxID=595528 RepID=A0A0D2WQT4_CAPO3|nr:splicing factor 3b [Capsaspora owczarzaki ATCC 30864]KJE93418.1 splicing factor 3b [Capsaspora owczarzaki ATCC 30864]|eukprot:XP_004348036.1 splicing factor 3b [Capsaspora owczarzaki ATCC 30864]
MQQQADDVEAEIRQLQASRRSNSATAYADDDGSEGYLNAGTTTTAKSGQRRGNAHQQQGRGHYDRDDADHDDADHDDDDADGDNGAGGLVGGGERARQRRLKQMDIDVDDEEIGSAGDPTGTMGARQSHHTRAMQELEAAHADHDPFKEFQRKKLTETESEYSARRLNRMLSPERADPFAAAVAAGAKGGAAAAADGSGAATGRTYKQAMEEAALLREEAELKRKIKEKQDKEAEQLQLQQQQGIAAAPIAAPRKRRWDQTASDVPSTASAAAATATAATDDDAPAAKRPAPAQSEWDADDATVSSSIRARTAAADSGAPSSASRWDETPRADSAASTGGATGGATARRSRWDETPAADRSGAAAETPRSRRSRWDETPVHTGGGPGGFGAETPVGAAAYGAATPLVGGLAGKLGFGAAAPGPSSRLDMELNERNRFMSDDDLDAILPKDGYRIINPPASYVPIRTPSRKLQATPVGEHGGAQAGFFLQEEQRGNHHGIEAIQPPGGLPALRPEDKQHFAKLMTEVDEDALSVEELKERRIMKLLLKIKNGTPPVRKVALRQITDKARELGAGPLFNQILPLLMSPLDEQERHLLVKVIDRILYKLDELVRPYVHKILVVIAPLLIDESYFARSEGREIVANLAKAAGLPTMISVMRPDIDNPDEYVRNTTARAFAVVASALGIQSLVPFLKAVCKSKKSWQARHTGIKVVQQIAILIGCAVLPHLKSLVDIIEEGLKDTEQKVRTITALAIAALAEAATPYGIESFDSVLKPLWKGIKHHSGKGLAAFLKAIGHIIPLMDAEYANFYTRDVMVVLIHEFASPDPEMKLIVLKVVKQCCSTDGVEPAYIRDEVLPEFFRHFWVSRMAAEPRNYRAVVETTVELASRVGVSDIVRRIVDDLKHENEFYRRMVMQTIEKIITNLGAADIDSDLEVRLMDGVMHAFQEQQQEDHAILSGFGVVCNALGQRTKPYLAQICGIILWRLNNKTARIRQQAADLISRTASVMKACDEDAQLKRLGTVLYEYLGEEYPDVLASIINALKAIASVLGMQDMSPPIKDLLPRITPILRNRHERVAEAIIDLVGRIADHGPEFVSAREWMRIAFLLLELLKAPRRSIRRAAVNTFGYIAKAIGPHDVLTTLLNNLKVQERQLRVCTTVAIAIVAETCAPYTILPALMNEYRVPELNVQNGVLKSLSFLFEYIGEMGVDYVYAVTPLLEDALMDRDMVHRQTACSVVKHLSLGVYGFGCEDALTHLLNYVWPNIFETSPHVINAVVDAIDGCRVALGPCRILQYVLQGMFHPARRVRDIYWKVYNNAYIGAQDALVAHYPRIPNDERNTYARPELDYLF